MSGMSGIGLLTSFGAGVISFLSPCVLPLVRVTSRVWQATP
jgi:cytochrome c biogenesis protein CcdA